MRATSFCTAQFAHLDVGRALIPPNRRPHDENHPHSDLSRGIALTLATPDAMGPSVRAAEDARRTLCINHEQGNVSLEARCATPAQGLSGGNSEVLNVNSQDMTSVEASITAKLQQDPTIDHVVALDAAIALTAVQSKETAGNDATIVTCDTNADLVKVIQRVMSKRRRRHTLSARPRAQ